VSQLGLWVVPDVEVAKRVCPPGRGIHLDDPEHLQMVHRIYWSRWAKQVRAGGLDEEDVLQHVYMGFLARNIGDNPYNPVNPSGGPASLSNYVFLVITSVVRNAIDEHRRAKRRGWVTGDGEDVALTCEDPTAVWGGGEDDEPEPQRIDLAKAWGVGPVAPLNGEAPYGRD